MRERLFFILTLYVRKTVAVERRKRGPADDTENSRRGLWTEEYCRNVLQRCQSCLLVIS